MAFILAVTEGRPPVWDRRWMLRGSTGSVNLGNSLREQAHGSLDTAGGPGVQSPRRFPAAAVPAARPRSHPEAGPERGPSQAQEVARPVMDCDLAQDLEPARRQLTPEQLENARKHG